MTRWLAVALVVASLLGVACSRVTINPQAGDENLFRDALSFYERGKYDKTIELLKALEENYPDSAFKFDAELLLADAYFADRRYDEAADAYQNFKRAHPTHPKLPYVAYRAGLSYLKQSKSIDRDQSFPQKAAQEFELVLQEFPSSEVAREAKEKLTGARGILAHREMYVAQFYYRSGEYSAALLRAYGALNNYRGSGLDDDALLLIGKSHLKLFQVSKGKAALEALLAHFSDSPYRQEAKELLASAAKMKEGVNPGPRGLLAKINPIRVIRHLAREDEKKREALVAGDLPSFGTSSSAVAQAEGGNPDGTNTAGKGPTVQDKGSTKPAKQLKLKPIAQVEVPASASPPASHDGQLSDGRSCLSCHQMRPEHGAANPEKSPSLLRRMFGWLGF